MKKLAFIITALLAFPFLVKGQTATENYVTSTAYQKEYTWAEVQGSIPLDDKIETVTYYDGLGRPFQSVAQRVGGNRENLISPVEYDPIGRKPIDYLPLPVALNGNNEEGELYDPQTGTIPDELKTHYRATFPEDFYQGTGFIPDYDNPYSEKLLEASPLGRVLEQGAPGFDWHTQYSDHIIKFGYQTNAANEVHHFSVAFNTNGSGGTDYTDPYLVYEGFYPSDELLRNITKDENWTVASGNDHTMQEFTDKKGQMLLKRVFNGAETLDTYYVYDDSGKLTYVLSPEASAAIVVNGTLASNAGTILDELGYRYRYDYRGRIFEKKVPGRGTESIIYDALDRPILTQDAEQLKVNEWLFTKYDVLGRVAYTGILSNHTKSQVQAGLNSLPLYENREATPLTINGTALYYSNQAFPNTDIEVHTINYYDTYVDWGGLSTPPTQNALGKDISTDTHGLPTVSRVRVLDGLDDPTPSQYWITTVTGYDDKARPIYVDTENTYLYTTDRMESDLDFTGKPLEVRTHHAVTGVSPNSVLTMDYFTYDHIGRLVSHVQQVDSEPIQLIAENRYDALGQLYQKDVGGETVIGGYTGIEKADVTYDGTIARNAAGDDWTSGAKTKGELLADGGVAFTLKQDDKTVRAGLKKNVIILVTNWQTYDYAVEARDDGTVRVIANGGAPVNTSQTYVAGDRFSVERVGTSILYKKNGAAPFYTVTDNSGAAMIGKVSIYGSYGEVGAFDLFGGNIDKVLQQVDYAYNVRGWLTDINDVDYPAHKLEDLFNFRINYNRGLVGNVGAAGVEPLYNGNISQTTWLTKNTDSQKRTYGYTYDALNRLTAAHSRKGAALTTTDHYGVSGITYDLNGNIGHLDRDGSNADGTANGVWDDLTYYYENGTNRLINVLDSSGFPALAGEGFNDGNTGQQDDFEYDDNGNLTVDRNKGITGIGYNHFDLPETVAVSGTQTGNIAYVYDAVGTKLKKTVTEGGTSHVTKYANGYVYLDDELQFFPHPEGYVKPVSGTSESVKGSEGGVTTQSGYQYVFQYTDHLGNVRLSYADSDLNGSVSTSEIVEESHYYPFGLKQKGYNTNITGGGNALAQAFKFGGKELNSELELEWYDFGARNYDHSLGRWMNIDPLADKYYNISPYVYVANMPIRAIDPDGKKIIIRMKGNPNSSANVRKRSTIQRNLQKLTNQKIRLVKQGSNFVVRFDGDKTANGDKNLANGTELISNLVGSKKTVEINLTSDANNTRKSDSGRSLVNFNPNDNGDTIANEDGTTGRPAEIGLAHELLHADENLDGETDKTPVKVINPDGTNPGEVVDADQDEIDVRDRENLIREEQKVPLRPKLETIDDKKEN